MKKQINVVGAVIVDKGNVLAAQRGQGMALAGMWEFPGGKIEENETPQQALQRELQEELKCTAEVGEFVATTEYEYDFGIVVLTTYYCTLIDGQPTLTEHAAIRWLLGAQLETLEWAPADIPAVKKIVGDLALTLH